MRREDSIALTIPRERPFHSIGPAELSRLVTESLTEPLLQIRERVGKLRAGDTLEVNPAPCPTKGDLLGSVLHHAQSMMIETLRLELGFQGIALKSSVMKPSITVPSAWRRTPHSKYWVGKSVLVTGASSGLGQAAALELARKGAQVYGVARRSMERAEFPTGGTFIPTSADVTRADDLHAAIPTGQFFAIIHAAGTGTGDMIQNANPDNLRQDIDVNVLGTLNIANLAESRLTKYGHLAIVSSGAATVPWPGGVSYVTGKAAQHAIAAEMAHRLKPRNVAVTAVLPGAFNSGIWDNMLQNSVLQTVVEINRRVFPSSRTTARQMLADIERGKPVSTAGLGGGTAQRFGRLMLLQSKAVAGSLAMLGLGISLDWLGSLSTPRGSFQR